MVLMKLLQLQSVQTTCRHQFNPSILSIDNISSHYLMKLWTIVESFKERKKQAWKSDLMLFLREWQSILVMHLKATANKGNMT